MQSACFSASFFTAIDGSVIEPSHFARNIGVIFDKKSNMERQVSAICKSAFFHIRNISRIRKFLSVNSACWATIKVGMMECRDGGITERRKMTPNPDSITEQQNGGMAENESKS